MCMVRLTRHIQVLKVYDKGNVYLAGPIQLINRPKHDEFSDFHLDPAETRQLFHDLGWKTVVDSKQEILCIVRMNISKNLH